MNATPSTEELRELAVQVVKRSKYVVGKLDSITAAEILAHGVFVGKGMATALRPILFVTLKKMIYTELLKTKSSSQNPCNEVFLFDDDQEFGPMIPPVIETKKCDCQSLSLLRYGCKCGGV